MLISMTDSASLLSHRRICWEKIKKFIPHGTNSRKEGRDLIEKGEKLVYNIENDGGFDSR